MKKKKKRRLGGKGQGQPKVIIFSSPEPKAQGEVL